MKTVLLALAAILPLAAQVKLPRYARQVLPNGLTLITVPQREVPLVSVRVIVRGGGESVSKDLAGLAGVVAELLRRGSAKRTPEQFARELDALGATFNAWADQQSTGISIEALAKDLDAALDLLADAVVHPTFPENEVKKLLARRIDSAKGIKDRPQQASGAYFQVLMFGAGHPYGRTTADERVYARIERRDILDYHRRMYVASNMLVIAAGDLPADAAARLARAWSTAASGRSYVWKKLEAPRPTASRLLLVDKPDSAQTQILVGLPGIERAHPDRIPVWIAHTILGGRFTSILNQKLRVDSGLTYGAGSHFDQLRLPGAIRISSSTDAANTLKALDMTLEVLREFHARGITAGQLASAKSYIKGIYPTERLETAEQLAGVIAEIELNGLSRGEVDDLFGRLDAVTLETVNSAIRKWYKPENLTLLLLGPAAKFRTGLEKYASRRAEISIRDPGVEIPPAVAIAAGSQPGGSR